MTKRKKYLICPGYVRSPRDGDEHWISADQLMRLYRVDPRECIISRSPAHVYQSPYRDLIQLHPDYYGRYDLPREEPQR